MKRIALAVVFWCVMVAPAPAMAGETVNGLRQGGWVVVEKQAQIVRQPGVAPYETMVRSVHVTTYVMEKGDRRKVCTLAYDSQLDTIAQECRNAE